MVKTKILKNQEPSIEDIRKVKLKKNINLVPFSPSEELLDETIIGKAILQCLKDNDSEGVIEIISIYLNALEKTNFAKKANIPRSTLYYSLKSRNPTIKTLAKIVHASSMFNSK